MGLGDAKAVLAAPIPRLFVPFCAVKAAVLSAVDAWAASLSRDAELAGRFRQWAATWAAALLRARVAGASVLAAPSRAPTGR